MAYLQQRELEQSQRLAEESRQIANTTMDRFGIGWSSRLLGQVAQQRGSLDEAREHFDRARRTFSSIRAVFEVAHTHLHLAEMACEQGEYQAATVDALEAYHRFIKLQVPVYIQYTKRWAIRRGLDLESS